MPCQRFGTADGMIGIICTKTVYCAYCGKPHTSLCDYPVGNNKTCDKPMCDYCRVIIGDNIDVCREHSNANDISKTLQQANKE